MIASQNPPSTELPDGSSTPQSSARAPLDALVNKFSLLLKATDWLGAPYEPYIPAVRSRSHGYAQRVPGDGCTYDFLSRPEFYAFLPFDHDRDAYTVIRPQFLVLPELTYAVSRLRKLYNPYSHKYPATIDFVVSKRAGGWIAVDFKLKKDREDPAVKAKLNLVTEAMNIVPGVERQVLSDDDIDPQVTRNLRFIRLYALPYDPPPTSDDQRKVLEPVLFALLLSGKQTIYDAAKQAAPLIAIRPADLVKSALWLIANRVWMVDLRQPVGPDYPLVNLSRR